MSFSWDEYLEIAKFLQVGPTTGTSGFSSDATSRCAVSRAYYAAFCHARNYARDKQGFKPTSTPADHGLLRDHYQKKRMNKVARHLEQLRIWRNKCDYDDTVSGLSWMVTSSITRATTIISDL